MANGVENGWFTEKEVMWPGQRFGLKVQKVLHEERSQYQDIMVFQSTTYGRVLVLDGVIQLTERDEFAYQEGIVHLPMFAHKDPKRVLIVGAGDGGVLREVVKHAGVEKIVQCEIDQRVVEVSKQFLGDLTATAFRDPRVELRFMDAAEYMRGHRAEFDVIIVDSSDPVGPAETLYTSDFYANMYAALRPDGVVCTQGECMWLHLDLIQKVMADAKALYPTVDYGYACVPTYPSGQIGFIVATKMTDPLTLRVPKRPVPADMAPKLRYYSATMHDAAFKLPVFAESKLASVRPASAAAAAKPLLSVETPAGLVGLLVVPALALAAGYLAAKKL